jgi:uncharacterized protein YjbI with pentapeptide repeats
VENQGVIIDLIGADLSGIHLSGVTLSDGGGIDLRKANLRDADLSKAYLRNILLHDSDLKNANLCDADLSGASLDGADLRHATLKNVKFGYISDGLDIYWTSLVGADLSGVNLSGADFSGALLGNTVLGGIDLREAKNLYRAYHHTPSTIGTDTLEKSKGQIPERFLRGCGLSDWEIEQAKLYNPELSNDEITQIQYRVYELRATQAIQISLLFISYSQKNNPFVDKLESRLNEKGIRFWRDTHNLKAGRMEKQINRAIRQNPTVLLVLSESSLSSDWVEHEVRTARALEKDMGRDVLCPIALDDSWKDSRWPKRIMEQIMEYNILDFSAWEDDVKFEGMFRKLIDGLELFYKR